MKRFLSICLAIALLVALVPAVPAMAVSQYGTVTGGWLRLRSAASFDASTISSYYTGTVVQILGTSGNWYNVKAPDGRTGYMYGSYITINGGGTGTAYVTSATGFGVRMRTGPGTG
ncbi:MAG: SH3 domain-containing protein, partial [Candidatus Limiplasma sp.]|nr:SH3 domain-containing protein [Candidatus Limiplasma sp.]